MSCSYNTIEFVDVLTAHHSYGTVKDPSGSDQLFTEGCLQIRSILNVGLPPALPVTDINVQGTIARIRHMLTAPRKPLYYDLTSLPGVVNGPTPIINLPNGDDNNGPWPDDKSLTIEYTTAGTLIIGWAVKFWIRDCGNTSTPVEPLSLRWSDSLSWDETGRATYNREGTLIISSRQQDNIDWFRRHKLGVPVCAGFKRTSARYMCSRDGLRCDFNFTDVQLQFAPPLPAVSMKIQQSECGNTVGGVAKGNVSVTMKGIQNANVIDLARKALIVMRARVWATNPIAAKGVVIGQSQIDTNESSDDTPVVTATCSYKVTKGPQRELNSLSTLFWPSIVNGVPQVGSVQPTQQGKLPSGLSIFPFIGFGTTPPSLTNPQGYADWANPTAAIGFPADGTGLAKAVSLFAALLRDPCGLSEVELRSTSPSDPLPPTPIGTNNTQSGQGGTPAFTTSTLSAASSGLTVGQYPTTYANIVADGYLVWDGEPAAYDHWQCLNHYVDDPGRVVLPSSDPSGINARVDYQSRMWTLVQRWSAERAGAPPSLPPEEHPDANWVYVGGDAPQIRELGLASDGVSIIYAASGFRIYQILDPTKIDFENPIPPNFNRNALQQPSRWYNTELTGGGEWYNTELTGGGEPFPNFVTGGSSPLGSNTLPAGNQPSN